jgi:hypothetical protein
MPYLAEKALPGRARADCHSAAEAILPALHNAQLWQDFNLGRLDDARAGARALTELGQEHDTVVVDQEAERDGHDAAGLTRLSPQVTRHADFWHPTGSRR